MEKSMSFQYLSDTHCNLLNSKLKKAFFNRLDKVSLRHWKPSFIIEAESLVEIKPKVQALTPIAKAKMISLRIRESNRSTLKKKSNSRLKVTSHTSRSKERIDEYSATTERKVSRPLPKIIKRQASNDNGIPYHTKYIEEVEKNFIDPYIKHKLKPSVDYVVNRRSKIPFTFRQTNIHFSRNMLN